MRLHVVLAIARKDVVDALRNLYVLFGIILPLGFWLLFKVVMPSGDTKIGPVAVFDQGNSRLVQQLKEQPLMENVIETRSLDELAQAVRKEAVGGLSLPTDFDEAIAAERSPEVTILINGRRGGGELAAFRRLIDAQVREMAGRPPAARLVELDVSDTEGRAKSEGFNFQTYLLPMMLVLALAMTGLFVVPMLLVEEKEKGTLKAIMVSPATYGDVVAGKAAAGLFYTLVVAVMLIVLNDGLRGNVALLALAIAVGSLFLIEVGLLMGAILSTSNQVNTWSTMVILLLTSPSWTVGVWEPKSVETIFRLIPTYYLAQLFQISQRGGASDGIAVGVGMLIGWISVLSLAIVWALRRAER
jgi:ABC-2 type transport system permease protein